MSVPHRKRAPRSNDRKPKAQSLPDQPPVRAFISERKRLKSSTLRPNRGPEWMPTSTEQLSPDTDNADGADCGSQGLLPGQGGSTRFRQQGQEAAASGQPMALEKRDWMVPAFANWVRTLARRPAQDNLYVSRRK